MLPPGLDIECHVRARGLRRLAAANGIGNGSGKFRERGRKPCR